MYLFILLPFIPMLGGILTLIYHFKNENTNLITNVFISLSLVLTTLLLFNHNNILLSFSFLQFDDIDLQIKFNIDKLSVIMLLMINFISFIIHRYSTNYLSSDITQGRFMAQLSILTFAVSLLVISGNLLTAFIAWQFIGLSLYILLNHYHYDTYANKAAKKKFIINRLGDVSFLIAIILCYKFSGNSDFNCLESINTNLHVLGLFQVKLNTLVVLLIFIAVMTKSAQFPFHIWLPDTMEAPTPVSAIMHAGVINAGGFLLTRINEMLVMSQFASNFVYTIGIVTILLAAFFILTQSDVKKQLAYSTMGQMGYMVIECSLGLYSAAIFHLIAHGFFKAFLFLSAGNNIGEVNNNSIKLRDNFLPKVIKISIFLILYFILAKFVFKRLDNNLLFSGAFILISILNVYFDAIQLYSIKRSTKILVYFAVSFIFLIYLYLTMKFRELTGFNQIANDKLYLDSYKQILLIFIVSLQFLFWFKISVLSKKMRLIFYDLSRNKLFIEEFYRHTLINPFRKFGLYLNYLFQKLYFKVLSTFVILVVSICCIFKMPVIDIKLLLIIVQIFFMLYIITANKAPNIRSFTGYIFLAQICLIDMGLLLLNNHDKKFLYYQIINSLLIYLAINMILDNNHIKQFTNYNAYSNKLGASKTYFTLLIFFWIGLPITPSFINEFYVLYSLSLVNLYFTIIPLLSFVFLAIAILHALQDYVFSISQQNTFKTNITRFEHCFLWICLIINLVAGLLPNTLLNILN